MLFMALRESPASSALSPAEESTVSSRLLSARSQVQHRSIHRLSTNDLHFYPGYFYHLAPTSSSVSRNIRLCRYVGSVPHRKAHSNILSAIALYHFVQTRVVFSSILQVSDSPMPTNRYIRLITMSVMLVLWGTVLTSVTIWANASHGLQPWVSLENVHSKWNHAEAYIWILMSPQTRSLALLSWWAIPVSSVIFFVFLGFGEDAVSEYKKVGNAIMSVFPSRILPERNEKFGKGMLLASPVLDPRSVFVSMFIRPVSPLSTQLL